MRSVIVIRHVPFEDVGYLQHAISRAEAVIRYKDIGEPVTRIEMESAAALILMGGPMSANDRAPWVEDELRAIDSALHAGRPVLGICLGAQLLARALGGRVYRNLVKEIGWFPIRWEAAAMSDPLFHGFRGAEPVFHWHGETFDLPRGAALLASSDACRNQAFRYDANAYGLQFHMEVTPEMIEDWRQQDANAGDMREIQHDIDPHAHAARQRTLADIIFGRWTDLWVPK